MSAPYQSRLDALGTAGVPGLRGMRVPAILGPLLAALLAFTSVLAGCAHTGHRGGAITAMPSDEVAHRIERLRSRIERHPEDSRAHRDLGHLLWLHRGETNEALPHLQVAADAGDVVSEFGNSK